MSDSSLAFAEPLLQDRAPRSLRGTWKLFMVHVMLLGMVFAVLLGSLSGQYSKAQLSTINLGDDASSYGLKAKNGVPDVLADRVIYAMTQHLKKQINFEVPPWEDYVKTSVGKSLAPVDVKEDRTAPHQLHTPEWMFVRASAILMKLYWHNTLGVGSICDSGRFTCLSTRAFDKIGPKHRRHSSNKVVRYLIQQLEKMGLVVQDEDGGRRISPKGRSDLDNIANQIIAADIPKRNDYDPRWYQRGGRYVPPTWKKTDEQGLSFPPFVSEDEDEEGDKEKGKKDAKATRAKLVADSLGVEDGKVKDG